LVVARLKTSPSEGFRAGDTTNHPRPDGAKTKIRKRTSRRCRDGKCEADVLHSILLGKEMLITVAGMKQRATRIHCYLLLQNIGLRELCVFGMFINLK
jgi:hypothetical protein